VNNEMRHIMVSTSFHARASLHLAYTGTNIESALLTT
jgi:hypothetical protein